MLGLRYTWAGELAGTHQRALGMERGCQLSQAARQPGAVGLGPAMGTKGRWLARALLGHIPGAPGQVRQERWGSLEFAQWLGLLDLCSSLVRDPVLPAVAVRNTPGQPLEGSISSSTAGRDPGPQRESRQWYLRSLI